jgi:hypothetical protein
MRRSPVIRRGAIRETVERRQAMRRGIDPKPSPPSTSAMSCAMMLVVDDQHARTPPVGAMAR